MSELHELDQRGQELLAELAANPRSECARQFDALFYEIVWKYLRLRHEVLAARVARYIGAEGVVAPEVLADEVDEVAHDATTTALRRVRNNAGRFDGARGTATRWVIGAAEFAYIEVAAAVVSARRSERLGFVAPDELLDVREPNPTTEEHVLQRIGDADALEAAAQHTSEREFAALRLVVTLGYSYREAAEVIFGDASMTKQVDGLLTRAKRKLAEAWENRKSSPSGAGAGKVPGLGDDNGGEDE